MSAIINIKNIKVIGVKRLNNSFMGNPKYKFYTKDGVMTTPSNAGWVYAFSTYTFINKKYVNRYNYIYLYNDYINSNGCILNNKVV